MKILFFVLFIASSFTLNVHAQTTSTNLPNYSKTLVLDSKVDTTANVSLADFDGDGHLDILLVKGRHWPIIDRILLGNGNGTIRKVYNLGNIADRSYTGAVADFNGDGFPDIAVSNDAPDLKQVYFNDGSGNFTIGSQFGVREWPTRNLSLADINKDGFQDLILANRGTGSNYFCLNNGLGQFGANCIAFAKYPATTITPTDINKDGFVDLIVPHRDGGKSYVYLGNSSFTYADSRRIQFGPSVTNIRMAEAADFNKDGFTDIVTLDVKLGVFVYLGQANQTFSTGIRIADAKKKPYALAIADLNKDNKIDIIVGNTNTQSNAFFNDGTGRKYTSVSFGDFKGTVYGFAVGDFNEDGIPDIAAGRSEAQSVLYFGEIKTIVSSGISIVGINQGFRKGKE